MDYRQPLANLIREWAEKGAENSKQGTVMDRPSLYSAAYAAAEKFASEYFTDAVLEGILYSENGGHNNRGDTFRIADIKSDNSKIHMRQRLRQSIEDGVSYSLHSIYRKPEKIGDASFLAMLLSDPHSGYFDIHCHGCGDTPKYVFNHLSGKVEMVDLKANKSPGRLKCPAKDLAPHVVNMDVPSRQLVIANDLRCLYDNENDFNVQAEYFRERSDGVMYEADGELGMRYQVDYWLSHGMAYLFVGNSSPAVIQGDEGIHIGQVWDPVDYDTKLSKADESYFIQQKEMKTVGSVSTDLWAVCMMDRDGFDTRCKVKGQSQEAMLEELDAIVVDVPGTTIEITKNNPRKTDVFYDIATPKPKPRLTPK